MASMLEVQNPKTGETYAVPAAYFRAKLEPEGWKALRFEDGSAYEPPAKKGDKGAKSAQDAPDAAETSKD